ncbi:MAG: ROK family protein [Candidatus Rokuibacteriota bacterium]
MPPTVSRNETATKGPGRRIRIGIDLGGTKIEAIALGADGDVLQRRRIPTPRQDYDATLAAVVDLVQSFERELGQRATVGIGTPGAVSPATGLLKNANSVWLNGRPLATDLESLLGRRLRVANDANCFALSEALDGAAAGMRAVFGVIVGTGTGGGLVVDGRIWTGPNAIAGEWGHNPLPWPRPGEWPGPPCYCGKTGCIETFLSGPGLARNHREETGEESDAVGIAAGAAQGERAAEASLARFEDRMARALASVINVLDPDVIVLGGGMSNLGRLYANVPALWAPYVFSDHVETRLLPPAHGDASGVRGAAWLWGPDD